MCEEQPKIITKEPGLEQTFGESIPSKPTECCKLQPSFRVCLFGGVGVTMQHLTHWIAENGSLLAVLVTIGVAVLLVSCIECTHCGGREKDEVFNRHEV
jgi:hypothetical protein